jgi:XRE family transcriptional regulator, aerobic/anaerobic benzoate catabolism transcriptional regulator
MNNIAAFDRHLALYAKTADGGEEEFIRVVGERVRMARARKGMSRKSLSEASRVSQRYLAQLEGGEGNISIALLKRIAKALDHRIEWLVGDDDPWTSDVVRMASLFRVATDEQKRRVLNILDPENAEMQRGRRIALVGLRGAGKSTLGRLGAEALGVPFVELNAEIEKNSGMPVHELMAMYGQEGYRRLERQSLERLAASDHPLILAVAGGIVSEPDTFNYLLRHFHTIWLKAKPQEHMDRVRKQGDLRPMAGNPAAMDELKTILTSRESLYARSQAQIDTSGKSVEESLAALLATVEREGFVAR